MIISKPPSAIDKAREKKHITALFGVYAFGLALVGAVAALPYARDAIMDPEQEETIAAEESPTLDLNS